jgi:hypothetical protein
MLKNFFRRFQGISRKDKVIFPPMDRPSPKKTSKLLILAAKNLDSFMDIRTAIEGAPIAFVNVRALMGDDLKTLVERFKIFGQQSGRKVYGIDKNWLIVSTSELQKP